MTVGLLRLAVRLPESQSLKEKRWILKSLITRIRNKFNVSVAEVDTQDSWQIATLGVAHVGNERSHTNEVLDLVRNFTEGIRTVELVDSQLEIF